MGITIFYRHIYDSFSEARQESKMLEDSVQITELVKEMECREKTCDNCQLQRKVLLTLSASQQITIPLTTC